MYIVPQKFRILLYDRRPFTGFFDLPESTVKRLWQYFYFTLEPYALLFINGFLYIFYQIKHVF